MDKKPTYDELDKRVKELEKESLRLKRAVVEMHREKEKFRILVEQLPMGVSIIKKSKEGHYEYINPKFIEMFGHTLEDIPTGKKWFITGTFRGRSNGNNAKKKIAPPKST